MSLLVYNQQQVWSEEDPFSVHRYKQFVHHFAANTRTVLDCGCNTGRGGSVMKALRPDLEIWGIDLVQDRIDKVPAGLYERLIAGSASQVPVPGATFDAVVAGEFIEHIPAAEMPTILGEFYRVLKPNGQLLLTTPNPHSYLVHVRKGNVFDDPSHVNIMSPSELRAHLTASNYTTNRVLGSGKASLYIGEQFPLFNLYGSYLTVSKKAAV